MVPLLPQAMQVGLAKAALIRPALTGAGLVRPGATHFLDGRLVLKRASTWRGARTCPEQMMTGRVEVPNFLQSCLRIGRGGAVASSPGLLRDGLIGLKVALAITLSAFNALCWALPLRMKRFTADRKALGIASAFSGGVFLALAFGHMIPEAAEAFGGPVGAAVRQSCVWALGGYLLIWAVERLSAQYEAQFETDGTTVAAGRTTGAAVLLGALSVHSILETMALAVARTKFAAVLLALSIALHQPAESVALLVALLRAGLKGRKLLRYLLVFTTMGPIGAATGLVLHEQVSNSVLDGVLMSLTAGTFVYVGASEVVPEEFEGTNDSPVKSLALVAGVALIFLLTNLAERLERHAAF